MRRGKTIAALTAVAAAVVLTAGGCGVQSTGVNIAQSEPFGEPATSVPQSVSPSQYPYTVSVFLFSVYKGPGTMISRPVAKQPTAMDLPNELAQLSSDEQLNQYTTFVPAGITLKPTTQAHMYIVYSPTRLSVLAQLQINCTFDQWWLQHPDGHNPSNRLFDPTTNEDTGWQDCKDGVVVPNAGSAAAAKPSSTPTTKADTAG